MNYLERTSMLKRRPFLNAPITVLLTGLCLSLSTPLCCALFPQTSRLEITDLENDLFQKWKDMEKKEDDTYVLYNKGL